jgi:hypothetical protein
MSESSHEGGAWMKRRSRVVIIFLSLLIWGVPSIMARQTSELAATLEVLSPGVEVLRVNTVNWVSVNLEAIVGVGDTIRTDGSGRARITFFEDGTDTEMLPNTEMRIQAFSGDETQFTISVEVLLGQTLQRLSRLLDASSRYEVLTPGMNLGARGTAFAIRVEPNGRSAMLVSEGDVEAEKASETARVVVGFGIRAPASGALSDVVRAATFDELDAALDGCAVTLTTLDDVSLNVRQAPGIDFPRVGTIAASDVTVVVGQTESSGWYRIAFRGGFGWILSTTLEVEQPCAGLRAFTDDAPAEDPAAYESLGDAVNPEELIPAAPSA